LLAVIEEIPALLSGYSEHGDLRQFLRRRLRCDATNPDDPGFISDSSLLDITIQISDAMQYLEQKRVVHRDLAARNCFVGRNLTVRVGDFGMSRNLYTNDYFKVTGNAVLPIRWSAWESIILGKFTTQSDVWSFGVTCFETFRLCRERPLESMTDEQVIHRMVSLYKERSSLTIIPWLPKPDICPEGVWEIIEKCWMRDADKRPTFKHLNQLLNEERRQIENQTISSSVKI
jgi:serine/threonine protein kinase